MDNNEVITIIKILGLHRKVEILTLERKLVYYFFYYLLTNSNIYGDTVFSLCFSLLLKLCFNVIYVLQWILFS